MSMFDIIGPVMIGPSSSHTAGAARIGLMARHIFHEEPVEARITVYGSFAKTYRGPLPPVFSVSQRMMSACAVLLRSRRNDM